MPNAHDAETDHIHLTCGEAETLRALASNNVTNAELAEQLGLSEYAINSRLHRLYERTGLNGRTAAVDFDRSHS